LRISILGASNLLERELVFQLVAFNPNDGVRLGLTALPNAIPAASGGLPTTDGTKLNQTAILANSATHGGAATVLTFKQLVGANSDAGASVIDLAATGSGNSHGIKINSTNAKALALGSTNSDGVSIDSGAAAGLRVTGVTGDIIAGRTGILTGNITGNLSGSVGSCTGAVTLAAGQLAVKKNTALNNFQFPMFAAADHVTPLTGLTITATRSIDGGAFAACAAAASEIGTSGIYKISLANTDLNGTTIILNFAGGATADTTIIGLVTQA
jgi:hypothetical protein